MPLAQQSLLRCGGSSIPLITQRYNLSCRVAFRELQAAVRPVQHRHYSAQSIIKTHTTTAIVAPVDNMSVSYRTFNGPPSRVDRTGACLRPAVLCRPCVAKVFRRQTANGHALLLCPQAVALQRGGDTDTAGETGGGGPGDRSIPGGDQGGPEKIQNMAF